MSAHQAAVDALPPARVNSKASSDYLAATLLLAALFHGVLIMGVSFTAGDPPSDADDSTSLEVVIVTSDYKQQLAPADAELLAERSLLGTGNTNDDVPVSIAYGETGDTSRAGQPRDGAEIAPDPLRQKDDQNMLLFADRSDAAKLSENEPDPQTLEELRKGLSGDSNPTEIIADPSEKTLIRSNNPRELLISANTRESRIATYMEGWKRKIERVGTMNFPDTSGAIRNPVLEVAVTANGELAEVILLRSSGQKKLDQAAVSILRMASPFDPFPKHLSRDFDVLRFSYEWYFAGDVPGSRLSISE
ncbi:MAG: protein TonB [Gammaproteobacteria bacterium]|jgi:protein TonB